MTYLCTSLRRKKVLTTKKESEFFRSGLPVLDFLKIDYILFFQSIEKYMLDLLARDNWELEGFIRVLSGRPTEKPNCHRQGDKAAGTALSTVDLAFKGIAENEGLTGTSCCHHDLPIPCFHHFRHFPISRCCSSGLHLNVLSILSALTPIIYPSRSRLTRNFLVCLTGLLHTAITPPTHSFMFCVCGTVLFPKGLWVCDGNPSLIMRAKLTLKKQEERKAELHIIYTELQWKASQCSLVLLQIKHLSPVGLEIGKHL